MNEGLRVYSFSFSCFIAALHHSWLQIFLERLLHLEHDIDYPVKLCVSLVLITEGHALLDNDAACLALRQFPPVEGQTGIGFNCILIIEEGVEQVFILADIQFHIQFVPLLNLRHGDVTG